MNRMARFKFGSLLTVGSVLALTLGGCVATNSSYRASVYDPYAPVYQTYDSGYYNRGYSSYPRNYYGGYSRPYRESYSDRRYEHSHEQRPKKKDYVTRTWKRWTD